MAGRTSQESKENIKRGIEIHVTHERHFSEMEQNPNPQRYVLFITGFCSICKSPLSKAFPHDFPDEWKWCCFCKMIAEHIVEQGTRLEGHCFETRMPKLKKLINLVG